MNGPRSTGVHSASLHPSSVCPSWSGKIIHIGCLTIKQKKRIIKRENFFYSNALFFSKFFLSFFKGKVAGTCVKICIR